MIAPDVVLESGVFIPQPDLVNLYGCRIGRGSKIGAFVEIQKGVEVGRDCKISSHTFICTGVTLEEGVFVGAGAVVTRDVPAHAIVAGVPARVIGQASEAGEYRRIGAAKS